jgi:hypothetical protein
MTLHLLVRELLVLAILVAFGAGFVALIPRDSRFGHRLALAPSAGVLIGPGLLMTVNFFVPLRHALWFVVLPAALLSIWLVRRAGLRLPSAGELLRVGLVAVVILGAGSYALVQRDSYGPVSYGIFDAPGYTGFIQGFERHTNQEPLVGIPRSTQSWQGAEADEDAWGPAWNLGERFGWAYRWQHAPSSTIGSVAAGGGGFAPWTVLSSLMVALLAAGALGTYALAGALGAGPGGRILAALLFGGPLTYMIFADGSEGMVAALAALPAVLVCGLLALEHWRPRTVLLAAAALGGLQGVYPELIALTLVALGLPLLVRTARSVRRRRPTRAEVGSVAKLLAAAVALAVAISPRTIPWTYDYLVVGSPFSNDVLVRYQMRVEHLLGWLYQTREFYGFAFADPGGWQETLIGLVLPLILLVVSVVGAIANRRALWLLGVPIAAGLQALWAWKSLDCGYCVQRSLLPMAPVLPALLVVGLGALAARGPRLRDLSFVLGTLACVGIASTALATTQRVREGATFTPAALKAATADAAKLPEPGSLLVEGFQAQPVAAWQELRTTYFALDEETGRRLSVVPEFDEWGGFAYFGTRPADHPSWDPTYRYALTRFGALANGRKRLSEHPPYFLQERTSDFDATVAGGVAADLPSRDPSGTAWVQREGVQYGFNQQPLTIWVAARKPETAYVRLRLQAADPAVQPGASGPAGTVLQNAKPGFVTVCAPAPGPDATRRLQFHVTPDPGYVGPPLRKYEIAPQPSKIIALTAVRTSTVPCQTKGKGGASPNP